MILVTGATGIVGSHIVLNLLRAGEEVRVLHRPSADLSTLENLLKFHGVEGRPSYFKGDIQEPIDLYEAAEGCNQCYHGAALVSFNDNDQKKLAEVNTYGTKNVVDMCLAKDITLCFISSTASIGEPLLNGMRTEESEWVSDKGKAAYTLSKRYGELEVFRGIQEGLRSIVVNPGVIIGPGNWGQSSTSIFLSGIKGMTFYPSGSNGFVDARDVADIAVHMMKEPGKFRGQHLLIGENRSFKEVFDMLAKAGGVKKPSVSVPKWLIRILISIMRTLEKLGLNASNLTANSLRSSITRNQYSSQKVRELGYTFRPIEDAINYTYEVYRAKKG